MKRQLVSVALVLAMIVACMGGLLPTTAAAYSETVYQAEEAVLGGAAIDTDHTGFTGTGFVDQFDALSKYVDFQSAFRAAATILWFSATRMRVAITPPQRYTLMENMRHWLSFRASLTGTHGQRQKLEST